MELINFTEKAQQMFKLAMRSMHAELSDIRREQILIAGVVLSPTEQQRTMVEFVEQSMFESRENSSAELAERIQTRLRAPFPSSH